VKKLLIHVPLAAMLCLGAAAPAAAQGSVAADRTPVTGTTITNPNYYAPDGLVDPRFNPAAPGTVNRYDRDGYRYRYGYGAGVTGNGVRPYGNRMNNWNDGSIMDRVDAGVTDVNRAVRRTTNAMRVRANAAGNDAGNWGWLGLIGLIGLAGMFRGGNREQHRT